MPFEKFDSHVDRILIDGEDTNTLGSGFGAPGDPLDVPYMPAEGPVWWEEGGYLLFSDIGQSKRMKWSPGGGIVIDEEPTNEANGLTRDPQGRLIACEHASRQVTRKEPTGPITVVAYQYQGKRLNRPNDVVVKSDGSIYFTDPGAPNPDMDMDFSGVYRVSPDLGTITLLVRDFVTPNGLTFSPDESILYINDSRRRHIRAFDLRPNGMLAPASDRVFCDLISDLPGVPDGMKVDKEGNVYCTGPGGIWIITPSGKHIGSILTGALQTTNVGWGSSDWKTLFYTTMTDLGCIKLNISGIPVPSLPHV